MLTRSQSPDAIVRKPRSGDLSTFLAITILVGYFAGADLILPAALQADLIEWDQHRTGYRRAGIFFAVWGMATKLSFAFAVGLAFPLLELSGFDASRAADNGGIRELALLYGGLPVVLKLGALALMQRYPVTRTFHDDIRSRLATRSPS